MARTTSGSAGGGQEADKKAIGEVLVQHSGPHRAHGSAGHYAAGKTVCLPVETPWAVLLAASQSGQTSCAGYPLSWQHTCNIRFNI